MKKLHIWSSLLLGLALLGVAFPAAGSDEVTYKGSTTVLPIAGLLSEALAPNVVFSVQGGGSGTGIAAIIDGTTDIAGSSRYMKLEEFEKAVANGVMPYVWEVAIDTLAIVVHPSNPIEQITYEDLRRIYFGEVTNWSVLGGPDMPIVVVSRDTSSGTYGTFKEVVLENQEVTDGALFQSSNGAMATTVASTPGAIGYVGLGYLQPSLRTLLLAKTAEGPFVGASVETALSLEYPLSRPLFMITNGYPQGAVARVIRFALSDEGQRLVLEAGYAPIRALSE
ncbi:MAG: phosphate ABC transporter substrate-binding protein [Candidatus Bipolaricaulota bacterium]|nr:phosphate ABC transporter substrate-binding protein [Candidatus Bipolaricaulota bacterium]